MAAPSEPVSALTLIMSSAVVSAGVNVAWSVITRLLDLRREKTKIAHEYLSLVLQPEEFVRLCNERLYDISEAMDRYRGFQDSAAFNGLGRIPLDFKPEPNWSSLPIPFVANMKSLPNRFEQCDRWITAQSEWAGLDDAYEFEEERLAFYALKAAKIAAEVRQQIGAGDGDLGDLVTHLESVIAQRRAVHLKDPSRRDYIPELRAHFESGSP